MGMPYLLQSISNSRMAQPLRTAQTRYVTYLV